MFYGRSVIGMKVWCVPVSMPNPEKEPEQVKAALAFLHHMTGIKGICPHSEGMLLLAFDEIENARKAKWKLEEYTDVSLPLIEGNMRQKDGKNVLDCKRVVKE